MSKDYYNILGVDKSASADEIKRAFRKKAHEFHPDKKGGDEAKFKEVNEAYQILGNADKRKQYDQFGDAAFQGQGFAGTGMRWEDFVRQAQSGGFSNGGVQFDFGDLGDLFGGLGDIFGFSNGRSSRRQRGSDIQTQMEISFREAIFGASKDISLYKTTLCDKCKGNGAEPGTPITTCKTCKGSGVVTQMQRTILGSFQTRGTCPDCHGEGKQAENKCSQCGGSGLQRENVRLSVKIPAGIDDGQTIKLAGQGEAVSGGAAGDLYITIRVKPERGFERDGDDILTVVEISVAQAVLGDKISVATVDGDVTLKIPAGTQSGTVFKLRGRGVHSLRGNGRGDQLVRVIIRIPTKLSRAERKLYEELRSVV
jgi:molecular chaperone DnaJ